MSKRKTIKAEQEQVAREHVKKKSQIRTSTKRLLSNQPVDVLFAIIDLWQQQALAYTPNSKTEQQLKLCISIGYEMIETRIREQGSA